MRRFVLIGQTAHAAADFSLDDLPGSSGRLDVLLRAVRAALLISHGVRRDVLVYLVLRGGERAPRVLRFDGGNAKFVRPDERSLAVTIRKTLATPGGAGGVFEEVRPGVSLCDGDLEAVLADAGGAPCYWLDELGEDVRAQRFGDDDTLFVIGDHLGFDEATRARLTELGLRRLSVGPLSLHSEDVVTLLSNELDRRFAARRPAAR